MDAGSASGVVLLLVLGLLLLAVVWIVLPFAVFGIKPLMRRVLDEQKVTNLLLQDIREELRRADRSVR